jgi:hypothetical protein
VLLGQDSNSFLSDTFPEKVLSLDKRSVSTPVLEKLEELSKTQHFDIAALKKKANKAMVTLANWINCLVVVARMA